MRKLYLVLAHHKPGQLCRLLSRLRDGNSAFYVHIDRKSKADFSSVRRLPEVVFLKDRVDCLWGDISIVNATLHGFRQILMHEREGMVILISGQDYPLVGSAEIDRYFEKNRCSAHMDCKPVREVWTDAAEVERRLDWYRFNLSTDRSGAVLIPPLASGRVRPIAGALMRVLREAGLSAFRQALALASRRRRRYPLEHHAGSQWFACPLDTVSAMVRYIDDHPGYLAYHQHTHCPDEIVFHTIVRHLEATTPGFSIGPSLTYVNWHRPGCALPVTFTKEDELELTAARASNLFARKFDEAMDGAILDALDDPQRRPSGGALR